MNHARRLNCATVAFFFGLLVFVTTTPLSVLVLAEDRLLRQFDRQQLTDVYYSEGISVGDINGDAVPDVVYGPYWFEGPDFQTKHEIYQPVAQDRNGYADNFFSWVYDFNGNGFGDVLVVGFPGTPAYVYENPTTAGLGNHWKKHQVLDWVSNESPQFVNLWGDETPELVCTRDGFFGFATVDRDNPFGAWTFYPISDQVAAKKFGHGLGIGDVNSDGRLDILHAKGWYEQPANKATELRWKHHEATLAAGYGGAEMYAYDVDGDARNDIITSDAAHDFGLSWYAQTTTADSAEFQRQMIVGSHPSDNRYGVLFSEPHSVALADIDGDGLKDIVTGKTYWSHHRKSPMWDAGAVVYYFQLVRGADGVDWIPHLVDDQAGVGRQICVADVNGDGLPDIVVGGMKGAHVLKQRLLPATEQEWVSAQPKRYSGPKLESVASASALRGKKAPIDPKTDRVPNAIEAEAFSGEVGNVNVSGGTIKAQPMKGFRSGTWSNHSQLWWTGGRPGDELSIDLPPFTGVVDFEIVLTCAVDYGIVQLELDEAPLGDPIDLFSEQVLTTGVLSFPKLSVTGSKHTLRLRIVGANSKAVQSFMVGLDYVRIKTSDGSFVAAPNIKKRVTAEKMESKAAAPAAELKPDEYPFSGLSAEQAAAAMRLPDGFSVIASAAEPDVKQPIAMALDDRGRVWIAEAYEYPIRANGETGRDRILVFEDTNGDGKLDHRKVFYEGLNLVSGLEVGFGGVWVGAAPYLMFIPDRNGDDVPDGEPQILLDGWGYQDTHETLNAFIWGPDGWLYGCHGVFTHSRVGKPGTPDDQRVPLNCAVWRYHPTKHQFEVFAHGTSNPWGVDFNDHGQCFITACVIPHLYHIIQGARYQRQAGQHFNPHTYQDIQTIADHLHYVGARRHAQNQMSDSAGGGHAHAGAMIYLADRWPKEYRNQVLMNNIHGQRLNMDLLIPSGSGYIGSHGPDFLLTGDMASQILNLRYGPDGNAWMIDWYDMQACHSRDVDSHDRSNGRIYKIVYGDASSAVQGDQLAEQTDEQLAELVLHPNDWFVRHSRRLLQERAASREIATDAINRLREIAVLHQDDTRRLRAAWALHVSGRLGASITKRMLADASPYVRGWAIQLAMESANDHPSPSQLEQFVMMAESDDSPIVRLYLASAAQRVPLASRWQLLSALTSHAQDADDANLPMMYWYAAEPLAQVDPNAALSLAMSAGESIPLLRQFMLRRIGTGEASDSLAVLVNGLGTAQSPSLQLVYLNALRTALRGRRQVTAPDGWAAVAGKLIQSEHDEVRVQAVALGVTFGDEQALAQMRFQVTEAASDVQQRLVALQSLLDANDRGLVPTLIELVGQDAKLSEAAIRGLAQYDDPSIGPALIRIYPELTATQKRIALGTLTARAASAIALLQAVEEKQIAGTELTADLIQQLRFLQNKQVDRLIETVWGTVRESAADKLAMIAEYTKLVESDSHPQPDLELGRAVFTQTCMKCHMLYGVGYKVGPDLTGSNRANLEYLLSNIVDPSAVMAKEYQPTVLLTIDGRIVSGLVKEQTERSITLQTSDSVVTIPLDEVEEQSEGAKSMMPEDQLKQFSPHEIRSLIAYLRAKEQTPMLATSENVATFFNEKDLSGWLGTSGLWSVESGELIGRTEGLKRNEWIVSELAVENFRLSLEVMLVNNSGNSGIQFRSRAVDGEVSGYQADIGEGWWGKLYEEHGRQLLWSESGEQHVKLGQWNTYEIVADGEQLRTFINGNACVDLNDPEGAKRGIIAFQLHSGGKTEVRFRNMKLQVLPSSTAPDLQ